MTAPAERWVVRSGHDKGCGGYLNPKGRYCCAQWHGKANAIQFASPQDARDFIAAEERRERVNYSPCRIVRLISHAEVVARAAKRARVGALEEVRAGLNQIACGSERRAVAAVADAIALVDRLAKESG